jgi:hypothetical protein
MTKDTTDQAGDDKFRRAVDWVEQGYDDRYPARGRANQVSRDYRPLEDVSREGRCAPYRKWPAAR